MITTPSPQPLPHEFKRNGHVYTQVERNDRAAIYSVSGAGFEVIRIRIGKETTLPNGKVAPLRELYPNDEQFGRHGWYFMPQEMDKMRQKFQEITSTDK